MAKFVTIKMLERAIHIERTGHIKGHPARFLIPTTKEGLRGEIYTTNVVYAMPVSTNYPLSHQWIAEISRWYRDQPVSAIYFEIDDAHPVFYGHYARVKTKATAAEACGYFYAKLQQDDSNALLGFEVLIPCNAIGDIKKVKHRIKKGGWRSDTRNMVSGAARWRNPWRNRKEREQYIKEKYG